MIQEVDGKRYVCVLMDPEGNAAEPNDENTTTMKVFDHLIIALQASEGTKVELTFLDKEVQKPWKFYVVAQ